MTSNDRGSQPTIPAEEPRSSRSEKKAKKDKKQLPLWQESVLLMGIALVLALVVKSFFIQAFYIPSESMEPGLIKNDRILVQKVSYWGGGTPKRGDVVVFKDPGGWLGPMDTALPENPVVQVLAKIGLYPTGGHLVKRVIGVAGDTIECCDKSGRLSVNGKPLDEDDYIQDDGAACNGPMVSGCARDWRAGPVPKGHIFVMGDNRSRSADSSAHMCTDQETDCVPGDEWVSASAVVGKVFVLLWPASRFTWKSRPETFEDVPDPNS